MPLPADAPLSLLRRRARDVSGRAHVPCSGRPAGAAVLLADGTWVPGARVESVVLSLAIPALLNAYTTAVAAGRTDVVAVAVSRPLSGSERSFLAELPSGPLRVRDDVAAASPEAPLPEPARHLDPFLNASVPETPEAGIRLAREVARRAHAPVSHFPVGCVLVTGAGRLIPGVNVEHADWSWSLCAERNALGTTVSYELVDHRRLYVTCLKDPEGTPCGACRQLLVELSPTTVLWMDRDAGPPEERAPRGLLPDAFTGRGVTSRS